MPEKKLFNITVFITSPAAAQRIVIGSNKGRRAEKRKISADRKSDQKKMSWLLMLAAVDNRLVLLLCQLGKGLNGHTVCVKFGLNVI